MSKNDTMIPSTFKVNSVLIGDFNINVLKFIEGEIILILWIIIEHQEFEIYRENI